MQGQEEPCILGVAACDGADGLHLPLHGILDRSDNIIPFWVKRRNVMLLKAVTWHHTRAVLCRSLCRSPRTCTHPWPKPGSETTCVSAGQCIAKPKEQSRDATLAFRGSFCVRPVSPKKPPGLKVHTSFAPSPKPLTTLACPSQRMNMLFAASPWRYHLLVQPLGKAYRARKKMLYLSHDVLPVPVILGFHSLSCSGSDVCNVSTEHHIRRFRVRTLLPSLSRSSCDSAERIGTVAMMCST